MGQKDDTERTWSISRRKASVPLRNLARHPLHLQAELTPLVFVTQYPEQCLNTVTLLFLYICLLSLSYEVFGGSAFSIILAPGPGGEPGSSTEQVFIGEKESMERAEESARANAFLCALPQASLDVLT